MNITTYERLDGVQNIIESDEDEANAEFQELCEMIDGTVGFVAITLLLCVVAFILM